jgi:L-alanine-DL-glutamate epimerase-like enolase superfamily enzyme
MRITDLEVLHCDAGWRYFSFLKLSTDAGIVGYSEFNECFGGYGISTVIQNLSSLVIGQDPLAHEKLYCDMYSVTRPGAGGVIGMGIAAIENALLDIKGKALGLPVYKLLGGPIRDRIRVYWSHCGTYRISRHDCLGTPPVRNLDDVAALGREVVEKGFTALKTNIFLFDDKPMLYSPGFNRPSGMPELNAERRVIEALRAQIGVFRETVGPDVDILLDLNFNFKTEGYVKIVRALEPFGLFWIEIDSYDAKALRYIRDHSTTPISSCETLFGIREFKPYFENYAMDVAIIDAVWNGVAQSMKIAAMAEAYEMNVAPHNFYGHLSTLMNAHFSAAVPNFRIMEIDMDAVPWRDEMLTTVPEIKDGYLQLPTGPGWGADVREDFVRAHPAKATYTGLASTSRL